MAAFEWPDRRRAAISLTFDDARPSNVEHGVPILDRHGVLATFYVLPSDLPYCLQAWKQAVAAGHEIGSCGKVLCGLPGLTGVRNKKALDIGEGFSKFIYPGDVLIFRDPADQVLPALESLTAVFGMGTGVTSPPWSPR